ncbi:MAG: hypothetical protein J7K98_02685 [Candidatus Aenigmarchaeota archaeon]|nr:hypothetical protein [Candidatus Aenigmarchaeota archaeon]
MYVLNDGLNKLEKSVKGFRVLLRTLSVQLGISNRCPYCGSELVMESIEIYPAPSSLPWSPFYSPFYYRVVNKKCLKCGRKYETPITV